MQIKKLAKIHSGHLSRGKIEAHKNGAHFLFQARDVDSKTLTYKTDGMIRFNPALSPKDTELKKNDIRLTDCEVTETRYLKRIHTAHIKTYRAKRASAITENGVTNPEELPRITMIAPNDHAC